MPYILINSCAHICHSSDTNESLVMTATVIRKIMTVTVKMKVTLTNLPRIASKVGVISDWMNLTKKILKSIFDQVNFCLTRLKWATQYGQYVSIWYGPYYMTHIIWVTQNCLRWGRKRIILTTADFNQFLQW